MRPSRTVFFANASPSPQGCRDHGRLPLRICTGQRVTLAESIFISETVKLFFGRIGDVDDKRKTEFRLFRNLRLQMLVHGSGCRRGAILARPSVNGRGVEAYLYWPVREAHCGEARSGGVPATTGKGGESSFNGPKDASVPVRRPLASHETTPGP
jgi:hypothetical protein